MPSTPPEDKPLTSEDALRAKGLRVVLAGPWNSSTDSTFYRCVGSVLAQRGATVTYLADREPTIIDGFDTTMDRRQWPTRSCRTPKDVIWVTRQLRSLKPDIVCARFGAITATLLGAATTFVPIRVLSSSTSPTALIHDWQGSALRRNWQALRLSLTWRLATDIFALSPGHADELRSAYRLGHRPIRVCRLGVADKQGPNESTRTRTRSVVCVARLTPGKGQRQVLEALAGSDLELTFVGDGPDREELAQRALSLGIPARFTGVIPPDDVRDRLANSGLSMLLTAGDAFALAIAESLAVGTPVITTDASGPRSMIDDGIEGFIVDRDDPDQVATAVSEALGDRWSEMSRAARARFERDFELVACANRATDQFIELASLRRSSRWR